MEDFEEYVVIAWPKLLRSAWLLTNDWHHAEDLVQTVLARVHGRWQRIRDEHPDAYLRKMMTTTYLTWWRRKWRREVAHEAPPDLPAPDVYSSVDLQLAVARALGRLPRRQRAVLMLRYHADMTESETARHLGITVGTVKSHTARALASLRQDAAFNPSVETMVNGASDE